MRSLVTLLLLLLAPGCASSLTTLQTARPLTRGQVQASGAMGGFIPVGSLGRLFGQGLAQGRAIGAAIGTGQPYHLSRADAESLLETGLALAVAPPGTAQELMVRAGVLPASTLDLGLRLSSTSLRLDGKLRLAHGGDAVRPHQGTSYDVALGLGLSRHLFRNPTAQALALVRLDDFSRWDLEVPLYLSVDWGDVFKLYAAPKYIYSRTSFGARLEAGAREGQEVTGFDLSVPARVSSHFYGASLGFALGFRWVHVYAELTAGYVACRPVILGAPRDLGGAALYPALGLAFKTPEPLR